MKRSPISPLNIAIIGSGISGLSAAWLLSKAHNVTVVEANDYIGGHSHTVDIDVSGKAIPVDTGFIVYNAPNYPNLTALFDELNVPTLATDMSFSASIASGAFEYAGGNKGGMLAQKSNVFRPHFWHMIRGILKFYAQSDRYLTNPQFREWTLRELLAHEGYAAPFITDYLGPMGAAIWSSDAEEILDYPAQSFLRFFNNHGLLERNGAPQWRTVKGGSRQYVERLTAPFKDRIRLNTPVQKIEATGNGVIIHTNLAQPERFDRVLMACHSDQAAALLPASMIAERDHLARLPYRDNTVILHSDTSLMPRRKKAWASWNYMADNRDDKSPAVTYWMNRLQSLETDVPIFVTLSGANKVAKDKIFDTFNYAHPTFNFAAQKAKRALWNIQGRNNIWFAGAYFGDGFHEDGIQSGLAAAELMGGAERPWHKPGQNARIGQPDDLTKPLLLAAE